MFAPVGFRLRMSRSDRPSACTRPDAITASTRCASSTPLTEVRGARDPQDQDWLEGVQRSFKPPIGGEIEAGRLGEFAATELRNRVAREAESLRLAEQSFPEAYRRQFRDSEGSVMDEITPLRNASSQPQTAPLDRDRLIAEYRRELHRHSTQFLGISREIARLAKLKRAGTITASEFRNRLDGPDGLDRQSLRVVAEIDRIHAVLDKLLHSRQGTERSSVKPTSRDPADARRGRKPSGGADEAPSVADEDSNASVDAARLPSASGFDPESGVTTTSTQNSDGSRDVVRTDREW